MPKNGENSFLFLLVKSFTEMVSIKYFNCVDLFQGTAVARSLHTPSNYHDSNYQRYIRIFSLQLRKHPIKITMKQMFTVNHSLLKSVRLKIEMTIDDNSREIKMETFLLIVLDHRFDNNICGNCYTISNC